MPHLRYSSSSSAGRPNDVAIALATTAKRCRYLKMKQKMWLLWPHLGAAEKQPGHDGRFVVLAQKQGTVLALLKQIRDQRVAALESAGQQRRRGRLEPTPVLRRDFVDSRRYT